MDVVGWMPLQISVFLHYNRLRKPRSHPRAFQGDRKGSPPSVNWVFLTVGIPRCLEPDMLGNEHKHLFVSLSQKYRVHFI